VELSEADRIAEKKSREGIEAGSKRSEKDKHFSIPDQLQQRYIQVDHQCPNNGEGCIETALIALACW
jgi:hypothetical protein